MNLKTKTNKIKSMLAKTQNTILSAAFILAIATGFNAVLGLIKSRLLVQYFGVSNHLAIFYTADKIPNLIYSVLVIGAFSTVFIPVFTEKLKKNKEAAFKSASSIINATFMLLVPVGVLIIIFAPSILRLISLGIFSDSEILLGTNLMRIMIASQVFLIAGSLITSILQSFKYFLVPALAPISYNLGMLFGIIFLSPKMGIYGPALGVVLGSLLHLSIQTPLLKKTGFSFSFSINLKDRGLLETIKLVPPRLLSVFLSNAVGTINNSLAIFVSTTSVVFLKFATQLQTFPVMLFGLSIASASLPTLSRETDEGTPGRFKETFLASLHQTLFLVLPASMFFLILRIPIVRLVYGTSNFPWEATLKTAYILAFFSLSVFAQSANYLITRAFYAFKDTKTPVLIYLFTMVINLTISVVLVVLLKLGVWCIALSFSLTSILDTVVLLYFLGKKIGGFNFDEILKPFIKISYAAVAMGAALYIPLKILDEYVFDTTRTLNLLAVVIIASLVGSTVYLTLTKFFKVKEIELFYKILRKLKLKKPKQIYHHPQPPISA